MPASPQTATTPPRIRLRAAAIVCRGGQVLLHRAEGDAFWALPGGGIESGESAAQAVVREMQEELGVRVAPGALACVVENFFTHAGVCYHETGLYLHAEPAGGSLLDGTSGPYMGLEGERRLEFAWFAGADLAGLDLRPAFLREALAAALERGGGSLGPVQHIVHRD